MVGDARFLHFRARIVKTDWPVKVFIPDKGKGLCPLPPEASRFRLSKLTGLFTAVFVLLQAGAVAQTTQTTQTTQTQSTAGEGFPVISDKIRYSLLDHPSIQTGRARTCQAIHRLGIQHAESRPQVSGHINSERQLFGHFKSSNNQGDRDRAEARGLNRQESNVYDLEVSLRHTLWDWHVTDNRVKAHQIAYDVERLRLTISLSEQVVSLIKAALRLDLYAEQVAHSKQAIADMTPYIQAIEAQGDAGFVRLVDVRRARLVLLDEEIRLREAETALAQTVEDIFTQFRLDPPDARQFLSMFRLLRPLQLLPVQPEMSELVRSIELQIRQSIYDFESISAELYPVLDVTVDATAFDLGDFESEYEVTGQMSVSMPLYDGGTNKARRAEASWRMRELGQDKRREIQDLELDVAQTIQQFTDVRKKITELEQRLDAQQSRFDSLKVLTERSDVPRLSLAEAISEITQTRFELLNNHITLDALRTDNLYQADQLISVLNLSVGERAC